MTKIVSYSYIAWYARYGSRWRRISADLASRTRRRLHRTRVHVRYEITVRDPQEVRHAQLTVLEAALREVLARAGRLAERVDVVGARFERAVQEVRRLEAALQDADLGQGWQSAGPVVGRLLAQYDIPVSAWTAEVERLNRSGLRGPKWIHTPWRFMLDELIAIDDLPRWYGPRYYFWVVIRVEPSAVPYLDMKVGKVDWYSAGRALAGSRAPGKRVGKPYYAILGLPVTWAPKSAKLDPELNPAEMFRWLMTPSSSTKQEFYKKARNRRQPLVHPGRKLWETIVLHYMARRGSMRSEPVAFIGFIPNLTWTRRGTAS